MPDPNAQFDLGAMSFEDIDALSQDPAAQPQAPPAAPTEPQAPAPREPFLRTSTGTVYNTQEEADRGFSEKDRQIDSARQWAIAMTGYDPISGKPARATPYTEETNYVREPEKFYDDLSAAAQKGDKRAYAAINLKLLQDAYAPVLTQSAKSAALENAERARPGLRKFIGTQKYTEYLDQVPLLQQAIQAAESRPEMGAQLTDLFVLTYDGASGRSMPEILKTARAQAVVPANPAPTRPTLQPVSQPAGGTPSGPPDMSTPEGRKAIIDGAKSRGIENVMSRTLFQGA